MRRAKGCASDDELMGRRVRGIFDTQKCLKIRTPEPF